MRHLKLFENYQNYSRSVPSLPKWSNDDEKKWKEVFRGYDGYHTYVNDDMKEEVKNQLGISDEYIKYSISEMQEDSMYWFLSVKVYVDALPEDKKDNFRDIVQKIIYPPAPTDIKKEQPKPGFFANIKKFFGM